MARPLAQGCLLAVGIVFSILANMDTGSPEAFQLVDNSGGILFALTYMSMFAIPLVARGYRRANPPAVYCQGYGRQRRTGARRRQVLLALDAS